MSQKYLPAVSRLLSLLIVFVLSVGGAIGPIRPAQAATVITFTGAELLGKPTDTSITINIVPNSTIEYHYQYGTAPGVYTGQTPNVTATANQPHEVVIDGLDANTEYYYRMRYHAPGDAMDDWVTRDEHSFWTQRALGSAFTFTVTADSHHQMNAAHQQAMTNVYDDQPDFHIDLGDTFYVDNTSNQAAVNSRYLDYRDPLYLGRIGHSVPIFLSSGNHEEEEGWNFDDTPFSIALASVQARKAYYPTPVDDDFYSGNLDPLAAIDETTYVDEFRENYYAWEWGDALFVVIDPFHYTMELPYAPGTAGEQTNDTWTGDQWSWTLGKQQFDWFKETIENSNAKYKFVFSHQMVGGIPRDISVNTAGYVRGGAEAAAYFEWGGNNADGTWGFDTQRPGWGGVPIHQLMVENGVSAYFHGHDHQYVYERRDGIVYQEVPSPSMTGSGFTGIYTEGTYADYETIEMLPNSGHLRVTVTPEEATVEYVRSDATGIRHSYTIDPNEQASSGVSLDGAASSGTADDVSSISFSHTTGTGTDRLMLVGVSWNSGDTDTSISSVTFTPSGGSATTLTAVGTSKYSTNRRYVAIYRWPAGAQPPSGQLGTVAITFSGTVDNGIVAGAANFAGVDQITPLGTFTSSEGTGTNQSTLEVAGLSGDELVLDVLFGGGSTTLTPGDNQEGLWSASAGNASGGASTEQATGSSVTMSWTRGNTNLWVLAAVPINPAAAGTTHDLTVAADPAGGGTTTPAAGIHPYAEGSVVPVTATPAAGYTFDHWSGDCTGSGACQVTMDGDKTVTAHFATSGGGVVVVDGAASSGTADDVSSISFSHTTGTGTDRLMLVGVSWNSGSSATSISSVTFSYGTGPTVVTLDPVITEQTGTQLRYAAIYRWPAGAQPPSGQAGTVTITFSGSVSSGIVAGAANFAGVDPAVPLGTADGANGNSTGATLTLTGLSGDELIFDTIFQGASGESQTLTAGAGQTPLWNAFLGNTRAAASTEQATGSSVTMSWTAASSSYWAVVAVPINPAAAGTTYDLTVAADPAGGGTTTPAVGVHTYAEDTIVDVTAAPNSGYVFDHWSGDCTGSGACQVTMDGDKTVTAHFVELPAYVLTVNVTGSGEVTLDPEAGPYDAGTTVTLTPVPDACNVFSGWSGTDASDLTDNGDGTWSITMDDNKSVTATFAELLPGTPCYRVNAGGDTLDMGTEPDFLALHYNALDAVPGLTVSDVDGERSTTNTIDMTTVDTSLPMALFQTVLYNDSGGTMTYEFEVPNGEYVVLLHSAEHNFTSAGQRVFDIFVEGTEELPNYDPFAAAGGQNIAVTESIPTTVSDGVLTIAFVTQTSVPIIRGIEIVLADEAPTCYALTLSHTGNGTDPVATPGNSTGCPAGQYVAGASISLSGATPDTGWEIAGWTGTAADSSTASTNSLTMPASAHAASVNYTQSCYALTLSHTGNGTNPVATPGNSAGCPAGQYLAGASISLSGATPAAGWAIASWTGTAADSSTAGTNSLTMPASAHTAGVNYLRILGDVNSDGSVDSTDALVILSCDAGIDTSEYCPMNCGDVNADGVINSTDALVLLSYDAEIAVPYPVGQPGCPATVTPCPGCSAGAMSLSTESLRPVTVISWRSR